MTPGSLFQAREATNCTHDVGECLGVAVDERKPRRLHVYHEAMTLPKRMENVGHREFDGSHLTRNERLGELEGVAELATTNVARWCNKLGE